LRIDRRGRFSIPIGNIGVGQQSIASYPSDDTSETSIGHQLRPAKEELEEVQGRSIAGLTIGEITKLFSHDVVDRDDFPVFPNKNVQRAVRSARLAAQISISDVYVNPNGQIRVQQRLIWRIATGALRALR
jgi:hypothetical protein